MTDSLPRIKTLIQTGKELESQPSQEEEEEERSKSRNGDSAQSGSDAEKRQQEEESELKYLLEEKNSLSATLGELQDKLKKAEQNKEHWKLECQLLQMKVDKLKKYLAKSNLEKAKRVHQKRSRDEEEREARKAEI